MNDVDSYAYGALWGLLLGLPLCIGVFLCCKWLIDDHFAREAEGRRGGRRGDR